MLSLSAFGADGLLKYRKLLPITRIMFSLRLANLPVNAVLMLLFSEFGSAFCERVFSEVLFATMAKFFTLEFKPLFGLFVVEKHTGEFRRLSRVDNWHVHGCLRF